MYSVQFKRPVPTHKTKSHESIDFMKGHREFRRETES